VKVFTDEFVNAIETQLNTLEPLQYLTREQLCSKMQVSADYMNAISIVMKEERFNRFESVKSRGIRLKKS
jgi:hypothetical protein